MPRGTDMNHIKNIIQHRSPWQKMFLFFSLLLLANGAVASLSVRGLWILTIGSSVELLNPTPHLMTYLAGLVLLVLSFSNRRANRFMAAFLVMIIRLLKILVLFVLAPILEGTKDRKRLTIYENPSAFEIDEGLPSTIDIERR